MIPLTARLSPLLALLALAACAAGAGEHHDLIVRGGTVYDGTGAPGRVADVAVDGDRVVGIGRYGRATADVEIDARGLAVAPGFINMLSWANESLIEDGRSQSDLRQGVTLEVMGEGWSMGPVNAAMRAEALRRQGDITYDIAWDTLGGYLDWIVDRGISTNVASFVGATTVRIHELGYEDRKATPEELARMQDLVREAMREGALGVGSSLIYAPSYFADTDELIALTAAAAEYDGGYISHIRSEGAKMMEAIDELLAIARATGAPTQVYHLKAAGEANWPLTEPVLERLQAARDEGLDIAANVYPYTASATGLNATMPLWVQEGGHDAWVARLRDPAVRARVADEMGRTTEEFDSRLLMAGGPEGVLLVDFKNPDLRGYTGMTLAQVAAARGTSPEETIMDLVIEDDSRVGAVYFMMNEANVEKNLSWAWTSIGSDEGSFAPEGVFLNSNPHPRAYGSFARFLGHYVRDRELMPLEEGVRRLTSLPAGQLRLHDRGTLAPGSFADIVIFDPATIIDHATYAEPHAYATGVRDVVVNGTVVLRDGAHTDARPGQVVRGPGWTGWGAEP